MQNSQHILAFLLGVALFCSSSTFAAGTQRDIVLLLDNSVSMAESDPEFLAHKAVGGFLESLTADARVAVIAYDLRARLVSPLTQITDTNWDTLLSSLERIDYRGRLSNSAAGMERAIYELKTNGRAAADKSIIFLTDGTIDTGDPARNLEFSRWMRENLASEAASAKIKVFGIAFTDTADILLIQTVTHTTGGAYFRAFEARDLESVFNQIAGSLALRARGPQRSLRQSGKDARETTGELAGSAEDNASPTPVTERLAEYATWIEERPTIGIAFGAAVILSLVATLFAVQRKRQAARHARPEPNASAPMSQQRGHGNYTPPAMLVDLSRVTHRDSHDITGKLTWISRAYGEHSENVRTLVIKDDKISREHAVIEYRDYGYWVSDRGSINGTFVNGEPVIGERLLRRGDRVRFADFEFEFSMPQRVELGDTMMAKFPTNGEQTVLVGASARAVASDPGVGNERHTALRTNDAAELQGEQTILRPLGEVAGVEASVIATPNEPVMSRDTSVSGPANGDGLAAGTPIEKTGSPDTGDEPEEDKTMLWPSVKSTPVEANDGEIAKKDQTEDPVEAHEDQEARVTHTTDGSEATDDHRNPVNLIDDRGETDRGENSDPRPEREHRARPAGND